MAEINLLQANQGGTGYTPPSGSVLNKVGVFVLVLIVAAYGVLFFAQSSAEKNSQQATADTNALQATIKQQAQYPELIRYQSKLSNAKLLLNNHLKWSMVLGKFSEATLKTARFDKFVANYDGSATISGFVPDFASLDKQIKAYQLNQFQQYIKDVQLVNVGLSDAERIGIDYTLRVTFNKSLIQNVQAVVPVTTVPVLPDMDATNPENINTPAN